MRKPTQDREGVTGTSRDPGSNIQCPCCDSHVPAEAIDESALSVEAKNTLRANDKRQKFRSSRSAIDQLREEKARRMNSKVMGA